MFACQLWCREQIVGVTALTFWNCPPVSLPTGLSASDLPHTRPACHAGARLPGAEGLQDFGTEPKAPR